MPMCTVTPATTTITTTATTTTTPSASTTVPITLTSAEIATATATTTLHSVQSLWRRNAHDSSLVMCVPTGCYTCLVGFALQ